MTDGERYEFLIGLALRGNLEATVAIYQLDHCRDRAQVEEQIDLAFAERNPNEWQ
jgi:hypothetical protein